MPLVGHLGVPAETGDRLGQVDGRGVVDRLARLEGLEHRELVGVGFDQRGEPFDRVVLEAIDIGSFELQTSRPDVKAVKPRIAVKSAGTVK